MTRYDVVVLGGGIIGAAVAEELARHGQHVVLIERGTIGCEASTAAAGILSAQMDLERPGPFFELCHASRQLYGPWLRRLERQSGISVDYEVDGILYLAGTAHDVQRMAARKHWQQRRGLRVERWSRSQIVRREPSVNGSFRAGFFFPTEAQLDNAKLMQGLAIACRKAGVTIRERTAVARLLVRQRRIVGVQTDHGTFRAPVVINCLGSWASRGRWGLPGHAVVPAKGQILAFEAPRRLFRHILMSEAGYCAQRRDGRLIVGSTVEFVGFDKRVTIAGMRHILTGFSQMVHPGILEACALKDTWAGLRPCSTDRLPILGPTTTEGLYLACGHFRHGILLAPVTARLMADLLLKGRFSVDLAPFSPARF